MQKKPASNSFLYFFGSVALIITAIVATTILNRTSSTASTQDVRARASVTSLMRLTAIVQSVDESRGVVIVNELQFTGSAPESLANLTKNTAGQWEVSVSGTVNLASLSSGSKVELQVNPSSFNIIERSLSAAAITLIK